MSKPCYGFEHALSVCHFQVPSCRRLPSSFLLKEIFLNHNRTPSRLTREKATLQAMIEIYCRAHHGSIHHGYCQQLLDYALDRLVHCRFSKHKPTCAKCPVHCYKPEMREQIRTVMRYAGPRMIWRHPWLTIMHLLDSNRRT